MKNLCPKELWPLIQRKKQLERYIHDAQKRLGAAPEGSVRIIKHRDGYQFFHRTDPKDTSGVYIPKKEFQKARSLVQKKYDEKILEASREQLKLLNRFLDQYDADILKKIFEKSGEARKNMIRAVELPDEEYIHMWQAFEYSGKPFHEGAAEHYTMKHERVRSKSEVMIANALFQAGIEYRYEAPVLLGNIVVYSDFTALRMYDREDIRWEHAGLIDDSDYRNETLAKIELYEENGFFLGENLIVTAETQKRPLNLREINRLIRHYFFREDA